MSPRTFALLRIAYSLGLIVAPGRVASRWLGPVAQTPVGGVAVRGLAVRDLALSIGALVSDGAARRRWLLACAVSDLGDIAATLAADPKSLPDRARLGTLALAGGSAVAAGVLVARSE